MIRYNLLATELPTYVIDHNFAVPQFFNCSFSDLSDPLSLLLIAGTPLVSTKPKSTQHNPANSTLLAARPRNGELWWVVDHRSS